MRISDERGLNGETGLAVSVGFGVGISQSGDKQ